MPEQIIVIVDGKWCRGPFATKTEAINWAAEHMGPRFEFARLTSPEPCQHAHIMTRSVSRGDGTGSIGKFCDDCGATIEPEKKVRGVFDKYRSVLRFGPYG